MVCAFEKTPLSVEQCGVPESEREEPDQIGLSCRWLCTQMWELPFLSGMFEQAWCMLGSSMGPWDHGQRAMSLLGYIGSWDGACVHAYMPACLYMGKTSQLMHPSVGDHKDEMIWEKAKGRVCVLWDLSR